MQGASPDVRSIFAQGVAHHQAGRLDEAIACYRHVLALTPNSTSACNNLGNALCELGRQEEAEASFRQALALQPDRAELHNNLGTVLFEQEKLNEAVRSYRQAIALEPVYAAAFNNLGAALHRLGRLDAAEASIRHALTLKPDFPEAHDGLGMVLWQRGRPEEALASTQYALALAPNFTRALNNLGAMLTDQGRLDQAIAACRQVLQIAPGDSEAMNGMAGALAAQGDSAAALEIICQSLETRDATAARVIFADIAGPLRWTQDNPRIRKIMLRALKEAWVRPAQLARSSASLISQQPQIGKWASRAAEAWPHPAPAMELPGPDGLALLAKDELLCTLLVSAQNTDLALERFLTMARRLLLDTAQGDHENGAALEFHAALARQCFINEYVFFCDEEESRRAGKLRDALAAALESDAPISCQCLLAVAAYFPLSSLSGASRLLARPWPDPVGGLLEQQLREPDEEARLRATIPALTPIRDAVSRSVQSHYEENPYPRWVRIPRREKAMTIADYLRHKFPLAVLALEEGNEIADILCAGCGTGQLALELAQGITARVLAVDLSLMSLGYAARKAAELGLTGIEFAQADLLELGAMGRMFDIVESSGVLHHLAEPFAGWRTLLSLLRPGGFMTLGLYSKMARRGIVEARSRIAQWGYGTSAADIRRCRQDLLDMGKNPEPGIADSDDFFGISSCRDLLFHGQEQLLELPAIAAFLLENDLRFVGFETDQATLLAYRQRFRDDPAATNLRNWHIFEAENPHTFSGMYRFWVQKGVGG